MSNLYQKTPRYRRYKKAYGKKYYLKNRQRILKRQRAYERKHRKQRNAYRKDWALRKNYGITLRQYNSLRKKQRGKCAICRCIPNGNGVLHVDHNHKTGKVRGLLCFSCNITIGHLRESKTSARRLVSYLRR